MEWEDTMKLETILTHFPEFVVHNPTKLNPTISGITCNSKLAQPGFLFVAKSGSREDGNKYSLDAIERGAVAIVAGCFNPSLPQEIQLISPNIIQDEGRIAHIVLNKPSEKLHMVGITGTSGKTTTSYAIRHILESSYMKSGLLGTVEYIVGGVSQLATRTTPDASTTHTLLSEMVDAHDQACIMEVSSHALCQGRVEAVDFDVAVFTNLSHEHLDYHSSMEEYAEAKNRLFSTLKTNKSAVVNLDSPWLSHIVKELKAPCLTYSTTQKADLQAVDISYSNLGTKFILHMQGTEYLVQTPLIGKFNVENALAAIGAGIKSGVPIEDIIRALSTFQGPPGRLQQVPNSKGLALYIDYAHKEDALRNVLDTLKACVKGRLMVVFGCGGDRDREKRSKMASVAEEYCDLVIVTSDNPRSEDPEKIIEEIAQGFKFPERHTYLIDRKAAIQYAVSQANQADIVLIAGKGHEKYQEFRHHTISFDDWTVTYEASLDLEF